MDSEELPKSLLPLYHVYNSSNERKIHQYPPTLSCLSSLRIPFDHSTAISDTLLRPYDVRFNVVDGIARLIPENTGTVCSKCKSGGFGAPIMIGSAKIVCMNHFISAEGIYTTLQ